MSKKPKPSVSIAEKLEAAKAAHVNALAAVEEIAAAGDAAALAGVDAVRALRLNLESARDSVTVLAAQVGALTKQLREAEDTEAEDDRRRNYDAAKAMHESILPDILALAEKFRGDAGVTLARARRASAAVQSANADLPAAKPALAYMENDPRLAAGTLTETTGLAINSRSVTIFDPTFWLPAVPPPLPITRPAKRPVAVASDKQEPNPPADPGTFRAKVVHTLPRHPESPTDAPEADRPFIPRVMQGRS